MKTKTENYADNLWRITCGEIMGCVNMRNMQKDKGPVILIKRTNDQPLNQLNHEEAHCLCLVTKAVERLLKKEEHKWSPPSAKASD